MQFQTTRFAPGPALDIVVTEGVNLKVKNIPLSVSSVTLLFKILIHKFLFKKILKFQDQMPKKRRKLRKNGQLKKKKKTWLSHDLCVCERDRK